MKKIAYLDMISGISGDMLLGGFIDAGVPVDDLQKIINEDLSIEAEITTRKVDQNGIEARKVKIDAEPDSDEKSLQEILDLISESSLDDRVKEKSIEIFKLLGEAESKVHGVDLGEVHFHELGGLDSIIDVVGTVFCLEYLGIDEIYYSDFKLGSGMIETQHGTYPIPSPATMEIVKEKRVNRTGVDSELSTPTGVTLAVGLGNQKNSMSFRPEAIGYGSGSRDLDHPNLLRVEIGKISETPMKDVWVIETNIDDLNPEIYEYVMEKLLDRGALDAWLNPITMKKGRPGVLISVISPLDEETLQELIDIIFQETSTIGVRVNRKKRYVLPREIKKIETEYGKVKVKVAKKDGKIINIAPEYEQCKKISEQKNVALKKIYEKALSSAYERLLD